MGVRLDTIRSWKCYIVNGQYLDFINESELIAAMYHGGKSKDWIDALQKLNTFMEGLNDRQILPNIKKYLTDFIEAEIKCIEGETSKRILRSKKRKTKELISKAHAS